MEVRTEREEGVLVVHVSGRLDGTNTEAFEEVVLAAAEDEDQAMVMDLEKLTYISSMGLRAVLQAAKRRLKREALFALCSLPGVVQGKFALIGFDKIIEIYPTRAAALAALRASDAA